MTARYLSFWPRHRAPRPTDQVHPAGDDVVLDAIANTDDNWDDDAEPEELRVRLYDAEQQLLTEFPAPLPDPVWVETFGADGAPAWREVPQPVSLDLSESHPAARFAQLHTAGWNDGDRFELALSTPGQPHFWDGGADLAIAKPVLLIGERFANPADFWTACQGFNQVLQQAAPFDQYVANGKLGVIGAWWPQGEDGLFNTVQDPDTRRIFGDHQLAMRYAATIRRDAMVIVVVNSDQWGGAGGTLLQRPAWASIDNFNYAWADMALHELGHSFGLQDEYIENGPPDYPYSPNYPNVTAHRDAAHCQWRDKRTPAIAHDPTQAFDGTPHHGPETIGTFQGALYSQTDFYRPAKNCRMRQVNAQFCRICQAEIVRQLDQL